MNTTDLGLESKGGMRTWDQDRWTTWRKASDREIYVCFQALCCSDGNKHAKAMVIATVRNDGPGRPRYSIHMTTRDGLCDSATFDCLVRNYDDCPDHGSKVKQGLSFRAVL